MRTRTKEIRIRLTEDEFNRLNEKVNRIDMNREVFLRKIIEGARVYERVPHDVWQLTIDLRRIGTDLNWLSKMATWTSFPDAEMVHDTCRSLWKLVDTMMNEFIDPKTAVEIHEIRKKRKQERKQGLEQIGSTKLQSN